MTTSTPARPAARWARSCGPERTTLGCLAATVPAAAGASLTIWAVSRLGDVDLVVGSGGGTQTIGWPAVLVASAIFAAVGTATLVFLERRFDRGRAIGVTLATAVLLLSLLLGPVNATTTTGAFVLGTMHAAVWGAVVGAVRRRR